MDQLNKFKERQQKMFIGQNIMKASKSMDYDHYAAAEEA